MRYYIAVVHQEGNSAYGVHFPDVPGCFSAADDLEDLQHEASIALALHLEGENPPQPRSMDAIRSNDDVRVDLAEGAFLVAIPLVSLTGRSKRANITIDAGLLAAVDATAASRGLTRSSYFAHLARQDIQG